MATINISLPEQLKKKADALVKSGLFSSFSDLVRHSLRQTVAKSKYDLWTEEAKRDVKDGKATILRTKKDIKKFFESL